MEYIYESDLLKVNVQIIAQQCNCISKHGKGLSADIAIAYPHADFYSSRTKASIPGTIEVRGGKGLRWVCALYAQYHPGGPSDRNGDTAEQRIIWFRECLDKISKIKNLRHIAFPTKIGCGLAKGDWNIYHKSLCDFAQQNPNVRVVIVSKNAPPESKILPSKINEPATWSTTSLITYTQTHTPSGWEEFFEEQLDSEMGSLAEISKFLEKEALANEIFPPLDLIYTSFNLVAPEDVTVLIIGQDPYHGPGQAMGISFSVPEGVDPPPSLINIFKEMGAAGIEVSDPHSGDLTAWCRQGVFLINTALTVRAHSPKSHSKRWVEHFTPSLLRWMDKRCNPLVIIMWGNDAQSLGRYFGERHKKIASAHPSPLSASRGFFGSDPFNRANRHLKELGRPQVDWSL